VIYLRRRVLVWCASRQTVGCPRLLVTDEAGTPINGAQVQALSDWPVVVGQVVTTGAGGHFGLPAAPRTYSVAASASGYCSGSYTGVTVTAGQTTTVSLALTRCRLLLPIILKVP